jgi:hypothetical protein
VYTFKLSFDWLNALLHPLISETAPDRFLFCETPYSVLDWLNALPSPLIGGTPPDPILCLVEHPTPH